MMLLHRPKCSGSVRIDELRKRVDQFARGHWMELIMRARNGHRTPPLPGVERTDEEKRTRRGVVAQERVIQGQVSRARQVLTGAALAPKTLEILEKLRRKRCQSRVQPIALDVMEFTPETPVELDARVFATSLRSAPRGSVAGPGGAPTKCFRCVSTMSSCCRLTSAAEDFARAEVPQVVFKAFQKANMTALLKRDGGVRGIATRTSFLRLVAKSLARQFSKEVEGACAPFQFALSTRAGTDCVVHVIRALTDANPNTTVLSVDGMGTYDRVFGGTMLSKLLSLPALHGLFRS